MTLVTQDNWSDILNWSESTIVKFWSPDCIPCKTVAKHLEFLEQKFPDTYFTSVNIYELPELGIKYKVLGTPTTLVIENGIEVDRVSGTNYPKLEAMIQKHMVKE
jgi:thioredoxin 1